MWGTLPNECKGIMPDKLSALSFRRSSFGTLVSALGLTVIVWWQYDQNLLSYHMYAKQTLGN